MHPYFFGKFRTAAVLITTVAALLLALSVVPVGAQEAPVLTLIRDANQLVVHVTGDSPVSLVGLQFEAESSTGERLTGLLEANPSFTVLNFTAVATPACLSLSRDSSVPPVLPPECQNIPATGVLVTQLLPDQNIFWIDPATGQALPVDITFAGVLFGQCPADALQCPISLDAQSYAGRARQALTAGDFESAALEYDRALVLDPSLTDALLLRGRARMALGDFESARADFDIVLQRDPASTGALTFRGTVNRELQDYQAAIRDYTQAIELRSSAEADPTLAAVYNIRGTAFNGLGEFESALADFNMAVTLDPTHFMAYQNRGNTYQATGQFDLAIADYNRVVELAPDFPNSHLALGTLFFNQGRFPEALESYRRYLALAGDSAKRLIENRVAELEAQVGG